MPTQKIYATDESKQYTLLCAFLQSYKEKLLLSTNIIDTLGTEVYTECHLQKIKENHSDHFALDYNLYKRGFVASSFASVESSLVPKAIVQKPNPGQ